MRRTPTSRPSPVGQRLCQRPANSDGSYETIRQDLRRLRHDVIFQPVVLLRRDRCRRRYNQTARAELQTLLAEMETKNDRQFFLRSGHLHIAGSRARDLRSGPDYRGRKNRSIDCKYRSLSVSAPATGNAVEAGVALVGQIFDRSNRSEWSRCDCAVFDSEQDCAVLFRRWRAGGGRSCGRSRLNCHDRPAASLGRKPNGASHSTSLHGECQCSPQSTLWPGRG